MDPLVAPHIDRLVPYTPGKPVEELERELGIRGAVKLASNENPFGPSPAAVEAMRRAAADVHRYPDAGAHRLREALAGRHGVPKGEVFLGNGSNEILQLLCWTFGTPRDHAVIGDPSFVYYGIGLTMAAVPYTAVPLRDHLAWNVDDLLAAVRPETKLLFLANPNNPTGAHLGREELRRLLSALPERVIAVVDEAYVEFADAEDYTSALEMRDLRERLVVLRTFSKAYGLASLRVGYAVAPTGLVEYLDRVRAPFNVGSIGQQGALAALGDPDHVSRYVEHNRVERARVAAALTGRGLRVAPSQANFLLVNVGDPGHQTYERLLRQGVIVRAMGAPIDTWLRITLGRREDDDRLLEAMAAVDPAAARGVG
ncbi:MAG: histidinol-phosphate transaminase [Myxococcota bacterium]